VHQIEHTEKGMRSKLYSVDSVPWSEWRKNDPNSTEHYEPHFMLTEQPTGTPKPLKPSTLNPEKIKNLQNFLNHNIIPSHRKQYIQDVVEGKTGILDAALNTPLPKLPEYTPTSSFTTTQTTTTNNNSIHTHLPSNCKVHKIVSREKRRECFGTEDTDYRYPKKLVNFFFLFI